MRLQDNPYLPGDMAPLVRQLDSLWRQLATQVNGLSEGQAEAVNNKALAAPAGSAVDYKVGDVVKNIAPAVLGTAGSQYIITGWICTVAGAPGTWVSMRTLTGT